MIAVQDYCEAGIAATDVWVKTMKGETRTQRFKVPLKQFQEAMKQYEAGALIQNAFSFLTTAQREFMMTGMTDKEWGEMTARASAEGTTLD